MLKLEALGADLEGIVATVKASDIQAARILERMDSKERKSKAGRKPTCRILIGTSINPV